jgi:hypothetical protein
MIKFFRKIRQTLLTENKFSKYLLYALGEILLVVIGILIALSINNLNETRKDRDFEQAILLHLREDYQSNLLQLEQKNKMRETIIYNGFKILETIDNPNEANRDSLITYLQNIGTTPTFDPIQNDLNSSVNIRLIRNEKLKILLSNWTSDIIAVKEGEDHWNDLVQLELKPTWTDLGLSRDIVNDQLSNNNTDWSYLLDDNSKTKVTPIGKSKLSTPLSKLINNRKIEALAAYAISQSNTTNLQGKALHKKITEILDLINSELKNK